ncbi:MAG: branched-chain amino acid ABC transporter substrate-binding protein [Pirellulales bacterium]|nr:branched-chain amino acid ABC transporter substrate-binding protein [Pirellulales bacterium]
MQKYFLWAGLWLAATSLTTIFTAECGFAAETIKIVSSLPRTGSAKDQTDSIVNGIKLALAEANYQAGGFTLKYEDLDDATAAAGQWTAEREGANAKSAAADQDVMVYIGPYNSNAAKISMPILNRAPLLMISPANTAIGLTKKNEFDRQEPGIYRPTGKINYTRVVATDDLQGPLGALWAKSLGVKKVYVLDDKEMYGKGIATLFADKCDELDIEVLGHDSITVTNVEFKALMNKIKKANPDLVYFGGTTQSQGGQIAKDMVAVGLKCKLMVPDGCCEQAFIDAAGADNLHNRCYVTFPGLPEDQLTEVGQQFYKKYEETYNIKPQPYAIYGYEAGRVAVAAINKAKQKDRQAIIDAALSLRDFQGALGKWSFDANGDTTLRRMTGFVVQDGKFAAPRVLDEMNEE